MVLPRVSVTAASLSARSVDLPGLRVTDVTYAAGFSAPSHEHEHDCVTLVLEGALAKDSRRFQQRLSVGTVALTPGAARHTDRFGSQGGRVLVVELLDPLLGPSPFLTVNPVEARANSLAWLGNRVAAELRATDDAAPLALHSVTLELLAILARSRAKRGRPGWLADVIDYLDGHLFEQVTLDELAAIAGVHRTQLTRAFRTHQGLSVGSYVRRRRVQWAADRLRSTDLPIAQISVLAGFADQSHFSRVFKAISGLPPGGYRAVGRRR